MNKKHREVHLESSQISKVEFFAKIVNCFQLLFPERFSLIWLAWFCLHLSLTKSCYLNHFYVLKKNRIIVYSPKTSSNIPFRYHFDFLFIMIISISISLNLIIQKKAPEVFYKKCVLRNFVKLTGKHLCQSLFFNKVIGLRPATFLKKRLWHRCFLVNFTKFLGTPFYRTPPDDCFWLSHLSLY